MRPARYFSIIQLSNARVSSIDHFLENFHITIWGKLDIIPYYEYNIHMNRVADYS